LARLVEYRATLDTREGEEQSCSGVDDDDGREAGVKFFRRRSKGKTVEQPRGGIRSILNKKGRPNGLWREAGLWRRRKTHWKVCGVREKLPRHGVAVQARSVDEKRGKSRARAGGIAEQAVSCDGEELVLAGRREGP